MTTYTISYFTKSDGPIDPDAQVLNIGGGWVRVVKTFEAASTEEALKVVPFVTFPMGSFYSLLEPQQVVTRDCAAVDAAIRARSV